ncbi:MAG: T9SS type A sorting domain-containing protein [Bacteroidetes bacterium]|nr:T9SS type A sorting domain-containing protein [Bacteroidota bacterium]
MVKDIALYLPSTLTAINDLQINSMDLTAYPNPFLDVINVTYIATVSGNISLSVIDITGRLIESKTINSEIGVNNISLNTTGYNNGLYMIRLETASGKSSGIKMIK